jgi:hypothetical protein
VPIKTSAHNSALHGRLETTFRRFFFLSTYRLTHSGPPVLSEISQHRGAQ